MLWIKDLFSFGENIMELVRKCIYTGWRKFLVHLDFLFIGIRTYG